jgi:hypothetical protein
MVTIEPELRSPAPRPSRLRAEARLRFAAALCLFLLLGGAPLLLVTRQIWHFRNLQREGRPEEATVLRQVEQVVLPGVRRYALDCVLADPSGTAMTARVWVDRAWWQASPPGSPMTVTTCAALPGYAVRGEPSDLRLGEELGGVGYALLGLGMSALLFFGFRLRPFFRDMALVSLGTPVPGRIVGRTWKEVRRCGRKVSLPLVHLHFQDPFGVERVRTQIVDSRIWERVVEGEAVTILVCCSRRRG